MSAIRSTNNQTELALRKRLHAMGFRYRLYSADLPGKPDIIFPSERVAVFVDGDYWHGRLLVEHGLEAVAKKVRRNPDYWVAKFKRNVARDAQVTKMLRQRGWLVVRLWESDVKKDVSHAASVVARAVKRRRNSEIRHQASH